MLKESAACPHAAGFVPSLWHPLTFLRRADLPFPLGKGRRISFPSLFMCQIAAAPAALALASEASVSHPAPSCQVPRELFFIFFLRGLRCCRLLQCVATTMRTISHPMTLVNIKISFFRKFSHFFFTDFYPLVGFRNERDSPQTRHTQQLSKVRIESSCIHSPRLRL